MIIDPFMRIHEIRSSHVGEEISLSGIFLEMGEVKTKYKHPDWGWYCHHPDSCRHEIDMLDRACDNIRFRKYRPPASEDASDIVNRLGTRE